MNLKKGFFRLTWVISIVGTFLITTIIHLSNPATLKEFFAIWGMYFLLTWGVYLFIKFVIIGFITKGFVGVEKSNTEINNTTPHELGPKITKIRKVGVGYIVGGAVCLFVSFAFYRPGNNVLAVVAGVGFLSLVIGIYQLTTGKKVKERTGFFLGVSTRSFN